MNPSDGSDRSLSSDAVREQRITFDALNTGPIVGDLNADPTTTEASVDAQEQHEHQHQVERDAVKQRSRMVKFAAIAALIAIGLIIAVLRHNIAAKTLDSGHVDASERYAATSIPLGSLTNNSAALSVENAKSLSINGQLNVNNSIVIAPTAQPSGAVTGQLYYNQTTNELSYYNGTQFTTLLNGNQKIVSGLGGAAGAVSTGQGVAVTNNTLHNTGVLTLQGEAGNVTLTGGPGIAVSGTTLSNSGVLSLGGQGGSILLGSGLSLSGKTLNAQSGVESLSPSTGNVTIVNQGNGNWTIGVGVIGGPGSGTVASSGGTVGQFAYFAGVQDIENSLLSQSGGTVTVAGNLSVAGNLDLGTPLDLANGGTGASNAAGARSNLSAAGSGANSDITSLTGLTTALSVSQGGTGVGVLPTNSVIVGSGTSAFSGVAASGAGQCLISTAGAPVFQACPGSGGVASINALTGALTLSGVSIGSVSSAGGSITINDATNAVKGLASFNGTNFTVTGGAVNTTQNINTGATPTFNGLNLSTPLGVGSGGTGGSTQSGARAGIGAAASGANSDITSINGLTTALAVSQGGTGLSALTANEILYASSASGVSQLSNGSAGACLVSNGAGSSPTFQTCTGAGGVSSLDTLTGSITLANSSGGGGTITINSAKADGATKGIAAFNSTNFTDNGSGLVNTIQGIATTSAPTFAGLNLTAALTTSNGGTGSTTAAGARTNLGAAASGANSDITSINGLTTALAVSQGGTGLAALTTDGILYANSTSTVSQLGIGTSGQCLVSNGTGLAPTFQTCTGAGGVSSLDALTGAITLSNSSGSAGTITINSAKADGATKGIAAFNSTNFTDNGAGIINTAQNIAVASTPTFGQLTLSSSQANGTMLTVNNTNAAATGNLINLELNGTSELSVSPGGNLSLNGTVNGQTIGSTSSFTGGVSVSGTLAVNTIAPTGALTVGVGGQAFTLQGNASSALKAVNGASTTTVGFQTPTANVTYNFATAVAGTYDICTTAGNCSGTGGGVTSPGGTVNTLTKFTAAGTIGNSIISDDGTTATVNGALSVNTITPTAALTVGSASQNLTLQGATVSLTDKAGSTTNSLVFSTPSGSGKTITLPNASGTVAVSASGPLSLDASGNLTCPTCLTGGGGGGTAGVSSLNSATGALTLQGTDAGSITTVGTTITINDAASAVKGLASFNATDLTVTSGNVDTVQSIAVTATPSFAGLNLTSALTVGNGGTGATTATGARTNLGAAKSGANSDITSLSGLTTALSVLQGGTGATSLTANGVLVGNGTSPVSSVTGSNGQCLMVVAGTPAFGACPGAGGVSSVDGLAGALTINNSTGTGSAITINNAKADGLTEGIATFNSTNFTDNGSGVINTIQDIATTSSPTFNSLNLTNALGVGSGGTGATTVAGARTNLSAAKSGANSDITSLTGLTTALSVSQGGTGLAALSAYGILYASAANTIGQLGLGTSGQCLLSNGNGAAPTWQTCTGAGGVSSLDALTGSITLANSSGSAGTITINNAAADGTTKGIAAFNSTNFTAAAGVVNTVQGIATTSAPTFAGLTLSAALSVANGGTGLSSLTADGILYASSTSAVSQLGVGSSGQCLISNGVGVTPTFQLCPGASGSSVTTSGGTNGTLAMFTSSNNIANSIITQATTTITIAGTLDLSNALTVANGGTGLAVLTQNELLYASSPSAISQLGYGTLNQCLTSNGSGNAPIWQTCPGASGSGVSSLDSLTGNLTISNTTGSVNTITINNAAADGVTKGIAAFNSTNFTDNGSGVINTIQGIATTSTPTFAGLNLTAALTLGNGGTGSTSAAGARTNLSAAKSGANSDITSLTGLTTALSVSQGGTGLGALTTYGILYADSTSTINQLGLGTSGQCLISNGTGAAPTWQTCTGAGGVSSLDSLTGSINLANSSGTAGTITIDNAKADGVTKGIAAFNSTNFTDNGSGVINTIQGIATTSTPTFAGLNLTAALTLGNGGTGSTSAAGARTNLSAAKSGANSDITSLTGLTTALSVSQGGTGLAAFTANELLYASSTSAIGQLGIGTSGQCLESNGAGNAPTFQTCTGAGGVSSLDALTGSITLANSSGVGGTVTINNAAADGSTKGIAAFNSTNFTAASGVINTAQNIAVTSAPTFGQLTLSSSQANGTMLTVNNTNALGTGNLLNLQLNGTSELSVSPAGNLALNGTVNGQTIGSTSSFTGGVNVAGTLGVNTIAPTGALTVGVGGQSFTLQGNTSSVIKSTNGTSTTTVDFQSPTANVTYNFATAVAGSYDVCTTAGNCAGVGGGVTTPGGTANTLAMFTASGTIGNSIITESGSTATIGGTLAVNTITPTATLTVGSTSQAATLQGASVTLADTASGTTNSLVFGTPSGANKTITLPNASGTVAVSAAGPLSLDAAGNLTCPTCLTSGGGGGTAGVSSVNSATGGLTLQGSSAGSISTVGTTITINDATSAVKGLAKFNSTDLTVVSGSVDTVQSIAVTATPSFAGINLGTALTVANGGTGATGAAGARTNLGAAASGANSDITSLSGLTTALSVSQGGTGLTALTANELIFASGTSSISQLSNGTSGQCLVSNGASSSPTFQTCTGAGGVSSVDGLSGSITIANTTGSAGTITIANAAADGATKGIAAFNSTNFTAASGVINTIQGIATTSTPTFAGLSLTAALTLGNGGTGATTMAGARTNLGAAASGANSDITSLSGLTTALSVSQGGTGLTAFTANELLYASTTTGISQLSNGTTGQCLLSNGAGNAPTFQTCTGAGGVSSVDGLSGSITIANTTGSAGTITIANAAADGATKGIAAFNSTNFTAASGVINTVQNINTTASPTFANLTVSTTLNANAISPSSSLTVGSTSQAFTLQGNGSSVITANGGGGSTAIGFTGTPTGAVTYNFDRSAAPGTYTICTSIGNCAGAGGGVTTSGGTAGKLAVFTGSGTIANSDITDTAGTNVSLGSGVSLTTLGSALFENATNSTTAFQLQNATGTPVFLGSTVTPNLVTTSTLTSSTATNWTAKGTATVSGDTTSPLESLASIKAVATAATSGMQTATFTGAIAANTQYQVTFYAKCNTGISTFSYGHQDVTGTNINASTTDSCSTNWQQYTFHYTSGATITSPNIYMDSGTTTSVTMWVDGVSLVQTNTSAATNYTPGTIYLTGVLASPAVFQNSANSTNAFQVQNSAGSVLLGVDTAGNNINVGATGASTIASTVNIATSTGAAQTIHIGDGSTETSTITVGSSNSTSTTTVQGGTGGVTLQTGATASGNTGSILIQSGNAATGTAGNVYIDTGAGTVNGGSFVENDTFESSIGTWATWFGSVTSLTQSAAQAHSGSDSLAVANSGGNWGITNSSIAASPGQIYTFSVWVRGSTTAEGIKGFAQWGPSASKSNLTSVVDSTTGWTQMTTTAIAPAGTTNVSLFLEDTTGSTDPTVYFDDITVTAGPNSPTLSLGSTNADSVILGNTNEAGGTVIQGGTAGVLITAAPNNAVNIGTSNVNTVTVGSSNGSASTSIQGGTGGVAVSVSTGNAITIGNANANLVTVGSTNASATTSIQGGTGTSAVGVQAGAGGTISVGTTAANIITIGNTSSTNVLTLQGSGISAKLTGSGSTPSFVIRTSTASNSAFQVQNASSTIFNVDTSGKIVTVNSTGTPLVLNMTASGDENGILYETSGSPTGEIGVSGAASQIITQAAVGDLNFKSVSGNILLAAGGTNAEVKIDTNGNTTFKNTSDSVTNSFQVQNAGGTNLISVNTSGKTVNIGATGTDALASVVNVGTSTGTNQTVTVGSSVSSSATTIQGGTGGVLITASTGSAVNIGTSVSDNVTIGNSAGNNPLIMQGNGISDTITGSSTAPSEVIKTSTNSVSAFQIQNASSQGLLTFNTATSVLTLGNKTLSAGQGVAGNLAFADGTNDNELLTVNANTLSNNWTLSLPSTGASGTQCLQSASGSTTSATTLTFAGCGSGITGSGTSGKLALFNGTGSLTSSDVTDTAGTSLSVASGVSLQANGAATFKDSVSSTTAFQIQNTSGFNVLDVDTTNGQTILGTSSQVNGAEVLNNSSNSNTVTIKSGATTASYSLTLPTALGSSGQCLSDTTGAGVLGWSNCGTPSSTLPISKVNEWDNFSNSSSANGSVTTVSPTNIGDMLVVYVTTETSSDYTTGMSGGCVGSWSKVANDDPSGSYGVDMWMGQITSTSCGTKTVTATFNTSPSTGGFAMEVQEFTATSVSAGTAWSIVTSNSNYHAASTTSVTIQSLTSSSLSNEAYTGYAFTDFTGIAGSTSGFSYRVDSDSDLTAWNTGLAPSTAYAPTATQSSSGWYSTIGAIFSASNGSSSTTLQQAYNNSSGANPSIDMTSTNGGFSLQNDGTSPITTGNLFGISDSGLTTGNAASITSSSALQTAGSLLNVSDNATLLTSGGTVSGSLVNVSRNLTSNISGGTATATYDGNTLANETITLSSTWTNSFTVTTNSNPFLYVAIMGLNNAWDACQKPSGITYNGVALTSYKSDTTNCIYYYGLVSPATGAAHNLVVSGSGGMRADMVVESFYNVNQTTPFALSSYQEETGSGFPPGNPSITLSTSTGQVAADSLFANSFSGGTINVTGATQTKTSLDTTANGLDGDDEQLGTSYATVSGSSVTMGWNGGSGDIAYIYSGIAINGISATGSETVSSAVASISNNCTTTAGSCSDATNVLSLQQQYSGATGTVLGIQNAGTGDMLDMTAGSTLVSSISGTGAAMFKTTAASANAFQILDNSGNSMFNVNSSADTVTIMNSAQYSSAADANPACGTDYNFTLADNIASPTQSVRWRDNSCGANLENGGNDLYISGFTNANYTGAQDFYLRGSLSTGYIYVGNGLGTGDNGSATVIVLDHSTTAPAVNTGGMYYDSTTNSFMCGWTQGWDNCDGLVAATTSTVGPEGGTTEHAFTGQTWTAPQNDCQAGTVYHITASGYAPNGTAGSTLNFALQDNGSDLITSGPKVGSVSLWTVDLYITCRSTTTAMISGNVFSQYNTGGGGGNFQPFGSTTPVTIANGSGGDAYGLAVTWSVNPGAGNGAYENQFIVQRLGNSN